MKSLIKNYLLNIFPEELFTLYYFSKIGEIDLYPFFFSLAFLCMTFVLTVYSIFFIKNTLKKKNLTISFVFTITIAFSMLIYFNIKSYYYISSRTLFSKGFISYQLGKRTEAIKYFNDSIKFDPYFTISFNWLAKTYLLEKDYLSALNILKELSIISDDYLIMKSIADLSSELEYYNQALNYYKKIQLNYNPTSYEIYQGIAEIYIYRKQFNRALNELSNFNDIPTINYLKAKCYLKLNKINKAFKYMQKALSKDYSDHDFFILNGEILHSMKRMEDALQSFNRAIWLKRESSSAYFSKGRILYEMNQTEKSLNNLKKAFYYDNGLTNAYILFKMIKQGQKPSLKQIEKKFIDFKTDRPILYLDKNQSEIISFQAVIHDDWQNYEIDVLEPYGFGISAFLVEQTVIKSSSAFIINRKYKVSGIRDHSINMGNPWILNFVLFNKKEGFFTTKKLKVYVNDIQEGKVLFVLSEDLEQNSDFPHANDSTPSQDDLDLNETKFDILLKSKLADNIVNTYGIKWSHFIDIGSTFHRLIWVASLSSKPDWGKLWSDIKDNYIDTLKKGNDIQLHIHSYNLPNSTNFGQTYDPIKDQILFHRSSEKHTDYVGMRKAWAYEYKDLGNFEQPHSRIGSIYHGIKTLEKTFCSFQPDYRTIVFRAGELDFGSSQTDMRKSIISLRKNKILCSSNASYGKILSPDFVFSKPIGANAYFSSYDNINIRAKNIVDIGILEIVPISKLYNMYYLEPVDDPRILEKAYKSLFNINNSLKPGVHILLEMYHMFTFNHKTNWNSLDMNYGDWFKLNKHMDYISKKCDKIKFVTISDAVLIYLNYYTPDVLFLRTKEKKIKPHVYEYDLECIGKDIIVDESNEHFCYIKPPIHHLGKIDRAELVLDEQIVYKWNHIINYEDIEFRAIKKEGYKFKIYLKNDITTFN